MIVSKRTRAIQAACMIALPLLARPAFADFGEAAGDAPSVESFLDAAREVQASIQDIYWMEEHGLYARKPDDRQPEFMWGNGVMFSALVAAARHEPETYRPVLQRFFTSMHRYWDTKVPIPGYEPAPLSGGSGGFGGGGGNDKYYDDNAWMVITFLEAYDLTGDRRYLTRARETLEFVLSGWDEVAGGGIWWHQSRKGKNTCSNAPSAVACVLMARHTGRDKHLAAARNIVEWTTETLQDDNELFCDSLNVETGHINRDKLTYNTGLMLRANLGLYRATGDDAWLEEAERIADNCDWFTSKMTGAYRDPPKWAHLQVEADLEYHRMTGDEAALARARRNGEVYYAVWKLDPPEDMIEQASIARTLWLLADHETEVGRAFWERSDAAD